MVAIESAWRALGTPRCMDWEPLALLAFETESEY